MVLPEIDAVDVQKQREMFPALGNKAYFNFGGQGTLSQPALDAIMQSYSYVQTHGPFSTKVLSWIADEGVKTKESLAEEFGGTPDSYAITQNTTEGCNIVLWGIEWQKGDHLLTTDAEHPGVEAAVQNVAQRRGVRVGYVSLSDVTVEASDDEIVSLFENGLQPETRLVVLSHVLWNTGRTLPVVRIQELCRDRGVALLIDGAQSAGVIPLDFTAQPFDYYAITGHKWIGGPEGVGALFIRSELIPRLKPTFVGWRSAMYAADNVHETATRFEVATSAFPLFAGLRAALDVHRRWGSAEERFARICDNVENLRARLAEMAAVRIYSPGNAPSSLLTFSVQTGSSHQNLLESFDKRNVIMRTIPKPDALRVSLHYFTSSDDLEQLLLALENSFSG